MKKFLCNLKPEHVAFGIMFFIVATTVIISFCLAPKCSNCGEFVSTAFCTTCGSANENYQELVVENITGLTCPICNVECLTPYCGDCGSEIVFVDAN